MGGVLWWLLAAVVSGSWLVMLALVLSLAAWAVFPVVVCEGWFYQSRDRNRVLVRLGLAVLLLLILRFGGQLALGQVGAGAGPAGGGIRPGGQNRREADR